MRLWFSGPRLGGWIRPGISIGREDGVPTLGLARGRPGSRAIWGGRKAPPINERAILGLFKRDDGCIFLGIPNANGENEHLTNVKPVCVFCFSTVDAAERAREGAMKRLAKHVGDGGLITSLSVGQACAAIRNEANSLELPTRFIMVTVAPPGDPQTDGKIEKQSHKSTVSWLAILATLGLIIAAVLRG